MLVNRCLVVKKSYNPIHLLLNKYFFFNNIEILFFEEPICFL
jgi:hypothetical protein